MLMVKPNVTLGATIVCLYVLFYFYFFLREFQPMTSALNDKDSFYHQTKIPNGFWCRWRLGSRSLIQLLKTLLVKLIRIHSYTLFLSICFNENTSLNLLEDLFIYLFF